MRTYSINGVGKTGYSLGEKGNQIYEFQAAQILIQNESKTLI